MYVVADGVLKLLGGVLESAVRSLFGQQGEKVLELV